MYLLNGNTIYLGHIRQVTMNASKLNDKIRLSVSMGSG